MTDRDPVAALAERGYEVRHYPASGDGQEFGRVSSQEWTEALAEQGYVLVSAEGLRRAYCKVKHGGEHQVCDSYNAAAILAAIQEQER